MSFKFQTPLIPIETSETLMYIGRVGENITRLLGNTY
jgi:hypothetical protein